MNMDVPQMAASQYAAQAFNLGNFNPMNAIGAAPNWGQAIYPEIQRHLMAGKIAEGPAPINQLKQEIKMTDQSKRRLVQVFIADPNESVPLSDSLLYSGDQKLTDLTDQELFFEIEIKALLDRHNAKRVTWTDKTVKDREQKLEAARVRDLKMVVVTVAGF